MILSNKRIRCWSDFVELQAGLPLCCSQPQRQLFSYIKAHLSFYAEYILYPYMSRDKWFPTMWHFDKCRLRRAFACRNLKWCSVSCLISHRTFKRLANALISLYICTGWSEPLLVAHTTLLEISWHYNERITFWMIYMWWFWCLMQYFIV